MKNSIKNCLRILIVLLFLGIGIKVIEVLVIGVFYLFHKLGLFMVIKSIIDLLLYSIVIICVINVLFEK